MVADQLSRAGYHGLFQAGERNAAPAIWATGEGRAALEEIVSGDGYDDLQRLLAAEVLFRFGDPGDAGRLARIYARGLALTGAGALAANPWGLLWKDDEGPLGIICGSGAIPPAIAAAVTRRGRRVMLFALRGFVDPDTVAAFPHCWIAVGQFGRFCRLARAEGSGQDSGALNTTITPSPAKRSSVPSNLWITGPTHPWYSRSTPVTSSGSAVSANAVNPRRSQNATVICLRSPGALATIDCGYHQYCHMANEYLC